MAHGLNSVLKRGATTVGCKGDGKTGIGSRRIFAPHFKLQVLDSYRNDADCKGNQRATARKYGIHRRQIQKWLQVENNLRNSVGKGKSGESTENPEARKCTVDMALRNRQRDDLLCTDAYSTTTQNNIIGGVIEARVPALSPIVYSSSSSSEQCTQWPDSSSSSSQLQQPPVPLDFTTHSRGHSSPIVASPDASPVPVDPAAPMDLSLKRPISVAAGVPCAPVTCPPLSPPLLLLPSPPSLVQPHPDVWDLSIKRKCEEQSYVDCAPKPVKLFKPYLDNLNEDSSSSSIDFKKSELLLPHHPCCSSSTNNIISNCDGYYYNNNNNNNNNICDIKSEYNTYTLHELQPKNSVNYYYTFPGTYQSTECDHHMPHFYEETSYIHGIVPLKQRHSYSLDFKLSAIECYYQDSVCKGNQRAVATKYNIHRRQVQKWLKQADELKQKNETIKQTHAVR